MEKKAIVLACRMDSERAIKLTRKIFEFLIKKGEILYLETRIAPKILHHSGKDLNEINAENTKAVISIGGDGTLLRISNSLSQQNPPPILGVNIGSVGFLDESDDISIFTDLGKIISGDYYVEECSKIVPYIVKSDSNDVRLQNSLNEVLIVSGKSSKILQVSLTIDGIFLNRSYLDGIIISTPIGSTAYNLSAGGAIISPKLKVMQITPLNPFARSGLKPLIVPIKSEIIVKLLRPRLNAKIVVDGQKIYKNIQPNTVIKIRDAKCIAKFIRFEETYYSRLRNKIIGTLKVPLDDSPEE